MNCPTCGAENADTSNFCTSCGAPLATAENANPTQDAARETQSGASASAGYTAGSASVDSASAYSGFVAGGVSTGGSSANPSFAAGGASADSDFGAGAPNQAPQGNPYMPPNPAQAYSYQNAYQQHVTPETTYSMTSTDEALRLANFVLCVISCVLGAAAIIPLAWMIPLTVHSWGIYKGKQPNTIAFGVCTLIFVNLVGGILLLVSNKDK